MRRTRISLLLVLGMLAALLPMGATAPAGAVEAGDPMVNEFVFNHSGTDTNEYVEVFSGPGADLSAFAIVEIEGDSGATGLIDDGTAVLGTADGSGYWSTGFMGDAWENGSVTLLLVEGYTGTIGQDLDTDDDGTLDVTPWTRVVDGVAVNDGGASDLTYASVVLSGGFDGVSFTPGGASRIPNGSDTDTVADWMRNDFDGAGLPGFVGSPIVGEAVNTPGAVNEAVVEVPPVVVINEVDYDQPGTDGAEFVELKNVGTTAADLSDFILELVNGSGGGAAIYESFALPAQSLAVGDYFVVCGDAANVPGCDMDVSPDTNLVQNGAPDAVSLLYDGGLVDTVSYEGDTAAPYTEGSGTGLEDPSDGSIGRCEDGVDTNQNNVDLVFTPIITPGAANDCPIVEPPLYKIHEVQGEGFVSPLVGDLVTIEGVVVGDFQAGDLFPSAEYDTNLGGYHVQEEDADVDGNPLTSEGVFVADDVNAISVGDVVRVSGTVAETFGLTLIESVTSAAVVGPGAAPTPATVTLPFTADIDFESVEGMSVQLPQALYISEYFNFDRFGEIVLSSNRAMQPTAVFAPGSVDATNLAEENVHSRITLDDGRTNQNPSPAIHPNGDVFGVPDSGGTSLTNLFRGGSTVEGLPGVMDYAFGAYRIQPTTGGTYVDTNPRESTPDPVGGDLKVATFNVLNYFTTLDDSGPICGPLADQGCRGADNALEFERQRTKIINAIAAIDADVVGLMEIENDSADVAVADLVTGLNEATAPGTYEYVATGPVGPDAIRVALIYQPASVEPYGTHAELAGAFLDPNGTGSAKNRAALAQSFVDNANGGVFTVAVNHLKSKGSSCGAGDDDPMQGSCNVTRTLAAGMLADWLQTDPTNSGDADFFIIGDLNSYDKEDPIAELAARGYADLIRRDIGEYAYSYPFGAQLGYLDYIMANEAVAAQVRNTTVWHINADEPDILDYDTRFNPVAMYEPNAFRSSDHDPVIAGLELTVTLKQEKAHQAVELSALLPTGNRRDDNRIAKAIESIEDSLNPAYWVDDFHLTDEGNKVFDEEKKAVKDLMSVNGPAETDAQAVIDVLVDADQTLAATAIADAVAAGGDERSIEKAEQQMAAALDDLAWDRPDKAIDHYKKAWHFAQKAQEEAAVRFATFNASLNRFNAGDLVNDLSTPGSAQPATIAEIIQRNRPEVLLVNEFDYDAEGLAAELFQDNYLSIPQNGAEPIVYPYRYVAPSNTGVPSGFDLDNDGSIGGPGDAFGFGFFEGQFAFVVYSMYPIDDANVRTFQNFLWKDMPGALLPEDEDGTPWFTDEELDVVRLSSKNHVDVPINVDGETVHFLVSHPTPPVFDGPEDRNGKRNYDEIRFWADYVGGGNSGKYIYDDADGKGGLSNEALFVIAGDQNADPFDGDSYPGAAQLLLDHPRINDTMTPSSLGGIEQAALQGGINDDHLGEPAFDTADFSDFSPGNLRADYVLPRKNMNITASGVFWPEESDPLFPLVGTFPFPSSDHRLVWIDIDM